MPLLSVIVPVYNEAKTIRQILEKIYAVAIDKEIIVVDDGSSDGTGKILSDIRNDNLKIIHHSTNRGKGAAFLTGLANASGEFIIIQDADLEYDPNDYLLLFDAIKRDSSIDIVLGARFTEKSRGLLISRLGNRLITGFLNFLFGASLNDCFTCYKLFRRDTVNMLGLKSQSFNIEIEIIAKALRKNLRLLEIPVSYHPRTYKEGKKIRVVDGIKAMVSIIRYRLQ